MPQDKLRLLIVEARFYDHIADDLLEGATRAIKAADADYDVVTVAGALEIPAAISLAEEGGHRPAGVRYDGYVALGCVIRGETYHFEVVANESARGLMDLSVGKRLPIGNGILTVDTEAQALERSRVSEGDKGGFAARACLDMITLKRRLLGQLR
ncbi:MAG TPA: 6,7-dimethyl-8-ribityllumazine synthase [Caulobacteraceae bacterium]|jgi:6,7-dimethyl-8-ribityllumazine synthase|nr:6,7-dimethyl-8-ribityllumazine synthase [Caulobacteraceae bacterium]